MKKFVVLAIAVALLMALPVATAFAAPSGKGPAAIESEVVLSATVVKDKGNTNTLTVFVGNESASFTIANNANGIYKVGGYEIYVGTYGNTKISDLYVVSAPAVNVVVDYRVEVVRNYLGVADYSVNLERTNVNAITVEVVESWEKITTTYAVYANGDEEIFSVETKDYTKSVSGEFIAPNGSSNLTYSVAEYVVRVQIRGNSIVDYELM